MATANWIISQTVDLAAGTEAMSASPRVLMVPGDDLGHVWTITVLRGGVAVALSGTVYAYFTRLDGTTVVVEGAISGNVITVVLTSGCYLCPGALWGMVRVVAGSGAVTTIARRLFRVQVDTSAQVADPGHIFDTAAALEDRVAAAEALLKSMQTAGSSVDYSGALAATIYEMERCADFLGTHPWAYYNLSAQPGRLNPTTGEYEAAYTTMLTTDFIRVPPSARIEISWTASHGSNNFTMAVFSQDRSELVGIGQVRTTDGQASPITTNAWTDIQLEAGQYVRFSYMNNVEGDKYYEDLAFRDYYLPSYGSVDEAVAIVGGIVNELRQMQNGIYGGVDYAAVEQGSASYNSDGDRTNSSTVKRCRTVNGAPLTLFAGDTIAGADEDIELYINQWTHTYTRDTQGNTVITEKFLRQIPGWNASWTADENGYYHLVARRASGADLAPEACVISVTREGAITNNMILIEEGEAYE